MRGSFKPCSSKTDAYHVTSSFSARHARGAFACITYCVRVVSATELKFSPRLGIRHGSWVYESAVEQRTEKSFRWIQKNRKKKEKEEQKGRYTKVGSSSDFFRILYWSNLFFLCDAFIVVHRVDSRRRSLVDRVAAFEGARKHGVTTRKEWTYLIWWNFERNIRLKRDRQCNRETENNR